MSEAKMRPTYLPSCHCDTRRIILVNGIIRCGNCYKRYGKGGSFYYTDEYLEYLSDTADKEDLWYQYDCKRRRENYEKRDKILSQL